MADLVRVRLPGGVEKNLGRAYAESHDMQVLDEPVRDRGGALRPTTRRGGRRAKSRTTVDKSAAAKKKATASESVQTEKEENR